MVKKVYYSYYKTPFRVTDENDYYYFSEGFLEQGETYCLKLAKEKCYPVHDCGRKMKWTWKYKDYTSWDKVRYWYCEGCNMIKNLEEDNKRVDWKTRDWSNETSEPVYGRDICHTCKYFMFHGLIWCPICGQKLAREKISYAEIKKRYPDYRMGY